MVSDCDGDGVDDATDAFDVDPEAWDDLDGDGLADTFPNLLVNSYETVQLCLPDRDPCTTSSNALRMGQTRRLSSQSH